MTFRGHIENGRVVLDGDSTGLPEGAQVRVDLTGTGKRNGKPKPKAKTPRAKPSGVRSLAGTVGAKTKSKTPRTLYERYKPLIGSVRGLPPDLSVNHDHYLYGTPKVRP